MAVKTKVKSFGMTRKKSGTIAHKNHRFQSFNERISNIKIEPVRAGSQDAADGDSSDITTSFFKPALDRWKDVNLSENFTLYVRETEPLCANLAQILHFQDRILDVTLQYIERQDALCLEPLFSLLSHLAHDLGLHFLQHLPRSLSTVVQVLLQHQDVEVIEWAFSSIAWLFKHFSRPIVTDTAQVYGILSPLLGKATRKQHIVVFAAEVLSFLVRKAALLSPKHPEYISNIIHCIFKDAAASTDGQQDPDLYSFAAMTIFSSAMKGVPQEFHSCAPNLLRFLLSCASSAFDFAIIHGVIVSAIHHGAADSFEALLEVILQFAGPRGSDRDAKAPLILDLMFLVSTACGGSRVHNWDPLLALLPRLLEGMQMPGSCRASSALSLFSKTAASIFHSAPVGSITAVLRETMDLLEQKQSSHGFLLFCILLRDLDQDRFDNLVSAFLYSYVARHWAECEAELLVALPQIADPGSPTAVTGLISQACPMAWQQLIERSVETRGLCLDSLPKRSAYIDLMESLSFDNTITTNILQLLGTSISQLPTQSKERPQEFSTLEERFLAGPAFHMLLYIPTGLEQLPELSQLILVFGHLTSFPPFLKNMVEYSMRRSSDVKHLGEPFVDKIVQNLSSSSDELRHLSLSFLQSMLRNSPKEQAEVLEIIMRIEKLPIAVQSTREGIMLMRRLCGRRQALSAHPWLGHALVHYCFGILTKKLSPWWSRAIEILGSIREISAMEDIIMNVVLQWLDSEPDSPSLPIRDLPSRTPHLSDFESSDVSTVEGLTRRLLAELEDPERTLQARLDLKMRMPAKAFVNARSQGLKVLIGLPRLAEKKARNLVPYLLELAKAEQFGSLLDEIESGQDKPTLEPRSPGFSSGKWPYYDVKALLDLFGQFQNPRSLYKSSEVHAALLHFLSKGDAEIQKSALRAIITWKIENVTKYERHLFNLLDEARFRDELTSFLHDSDNEDLLQPSCFRDVMPILNHILYGRAVTRRSISTNSAAPSARRRAVFDALYRFSDEYVEDFVNVALGRLRSLKLLDLSTEDDCRNNALALSPKAHLGLVNFLKDLISSMGDRIAFDGARLTCAVLYCSIKANRELSRGALVDDNKESYDSTWKEIRQAGFQALALACQHFRAEDLDLSIPVFFENFVNPKIPTLASENAHSISALLKLFAVWASSESSARYLVSRSPGLTGAIIDVLSMPSAKDEVVLFVIDQILMPLVKFTLVEADQSPQDSRFRHQLLRSHLDQILEVAATLISRTPTVPVLSATLALVTELSALLESSKNSKGLLEVMNSLLQQPSRRISPKSKGKSVEIISQFLPRAQIGRENDLFWIMYKNISTLFGYFLDRDNRTLLCEALKGMALIDGCLRSTAEICSDMNSYSLQTVDDPDFEKRIQAFNLVAKTGGTLAAEQCRPVLHNCLFYIKNDDISLRTSAAFALRQIVETTMQAALTDSPTSDLVRQILLREIRSGASHHSELVRAELLALMALLVDLNPTWQEVNDMVPLLMNGDEEASVFNNVLHIQRHRRLRALRRLAMEADNHVLRSKNVSTFWIPLLERFILEEAEGSAEHNLTAESIKTIATLAKRMEWPQVRAMLRRYCGYMRSKRNLEKSVFKMLAALIDTLTEAAPWSSQHDVLERGSALDQDAFPSEDKNVSNLAKSLPSRDRFCQEVEHTLLPPLRTYLHEKDEYAVDLRASAAVAAVKFSKLLPDHIFEQHLAPILTDLCHVLRSRSQDSRDITRNSLAEISRLIGSKRFDFILRELRGSLLRGYQLHVLSYTLHTILVSTAIDFGPGDLDHCLPGLMQTIMDDIFGATGQEKEAEDYVSKMKEVKSSKSFDSMEHVARVTSIDHVSHLVRPLKALLEDNMAVKTLRKADELLRRLGSGLLQNKSINDRATLIFCYEVLEFAHGTEMSLQQEHDQNAKRYLIDVKGARKGPTCGGHPAHSSKLARFALDLLRTVLGRFDELRTPANISGFLPILGDFLLGAPEEVQASTLRLIVVLIKVPLNGMKVSASVFAQQATEIMRNAASTKTEISQAALKLITVILRERHDVVLKDPDLTYLLRQIQGDLEEPNCQGAAFGFLKALLQRKIMAAEVYSIMDVVATIMITSHSENTRQSARGLYFQFLLNYPQAKNRLSKQLAFLVKNMEYEHAEGRQSVMEAVYLLLGRVGEDIAHDMVGTFFLPLVIVTVNDESSECRKMAGSLLRTTFERSSGEQSRHLSQMMRSWLEQDQEMMVQMSLQVQTILLDVSSKTLSVEIAPLQQRIFQILREAAKKGRGLPWESVYYALQAMAKLYHVDPKRILDPAQSDLWICVQDCLQYPHSWVKLAASQLLGQLFADVAKTASQLKDFNLPLQASYGILLYSKDIVKTVQSAFRALKMPRISEDLASQLTKLVIFCGRFGCNEMMYTDQNVSDITLEDEGADEDPSAGLSSKQNVTVLQYIFSQTSSILKGEPGGTSALSLIPKTMSLQVIAALSGRLPPSLLLPCISTILQPLCYLADPLTTTPFSTDEGHKEAQQSLLTNAHEINGLLQTKLGTEVYVQELTRVREDIKAQREGRKAKRRFEAIAEPDKNSSQKKNKHDRQRGKRKERNKLFRDQRRMR